jgi:hypothetical protein
MKLLISVGILLFSSLGAWVGQMMDHGGFGGWAILLTAVGGFVGIWLGYKAGKYFF